MEKDTEVCFVRPLEFLECSAGVGDRGEFDVSSVDALDGEFLFGLRDRGWFRFLALREDGNDRDASDYRERNSHGNGDMLRQYREFGRWRGFRFVRDLRVVRSFRSVSLDIFIVLFFDDSKSGRIDGRYDPVFETYLDPELAGEPFDDSVPSSVFAPLVGNEYGRPFREVLFGCVRHFLGKVTHSPPPVRFRLAFRVFTGIHRGFFRPAGSIGEWSDLMGGEVCELDCHRYDPSGSYGEDGFHFSEVRDNRLRWRRRFRSTPRERCAMSRGSIR